MQHQDTATRSFCRTHCCAVSRNRSRFHIRLFILMFVAGGTITAQNVFTFRYFGLTIHPFGDQTAAIQPYKLDKHAKFVANFGGFVSVDHYIFKDLVCVTAMQGVFTDCSGGPGGFSHLGLRALVYEKRKHRFMLGLGPILYYRRDWNRFDIYVDHGTFHQYHSRSLGDIQWRVFPVAGEFAWHWQISEQLDFNLGFTPGLPLACSFSAGISWWPQRPEPQKTTIKIYVPRKKKGKPGSQ